MEEIPTEIKDALNQVAQEYTESEHTTNAGRILRFICRFIKPSTVIKMLSHILCK